MVLLWGQEGVMIYNNALSKVAGGRHPNLLGSKVREGWPEGADFSDNIMKVGLAGGTLSYRDQELTVYRNGVAERVFMNLDYSPVLDESGHPAGVLGVVVETTQRAAADRRLRESEARLAFLDRLSMDTAPLADADAVLATTTRLLGEHLNLSVCAYADMDEDQDGFTIRGDWAAPGSMSIVGHYSLADFGRLAVKNLSAGLPLVVNDNLNELAPEEAETFQSIGIAATICMPLVKEGRLTALMAIHDRVPRVWPEAELALLREVTARSWAHVERVGTAAELREREARHRQILNSATDYAIIATDMDGRVTSWNSGARRVLGWTEEEMLGQPVDLFFTPEDVAAGQSRKEMEGALTEGRGIDERWHVRKSGERFWASGELTPLEDDAGTITGFVKVMRDRTEHRRAEDTLRQYAVLVESMTEGVSLSDENGVIVYTNPAEDRMFGYGPGELVGQHVSVQNAYPPEENKRRVEAVIAELQASGSWDGEWHNQRKDGTEFVTASRISAVEIEGRPHWLCVQRDITQAKKAEEHQRLLINELNHRVKNTLATVQSVASQTLRNAETAEEARAALESRLLALSRAHDVLTRENWEGADLFEIVADAVEPYSNPGEDRLHLSGETIRLPPRMALALAMALQELATNAVKYGALSNETGEVRITWRDGDDRLHLTWAETGGPPVKVPSRRGFGTRLIERSLASDLDGEVRISFEPTGLVCNVDAPLTRPDESQPHEKGV
jgi:PAS domain S-box-containing protein